MSLGRKPLSVWLPYVLRHDAGNAIDLKISWCKEEELALASSLGADISDNLPRIVAPASLHDLVQMRVGLTPAKSRESQVELLGRRAEDEPLDLRASETTAKCSAWIEYFTLKRRLASLRVPQLEKGRCRQPADGGRLSCGRWDCYDRRRRGRFGSLEAGHLHGQIKWLWFRARPIRQRQPRRTDEPRGIEHRDQDVRLAA